LVVEGISSDQRKGTFMLNRKLGRILVALQSFTEEMREKGLVPEHESA